MLFLKDLEEGSSTTLRFMKHLFLLRLPTSALLGGNKSSCPSLFPWWDIGKGKIKGIAVKHGLKKHSTSLSRTLLSNPVVHLKDHLDQGQSIFLTTS